MSNYRRALVPGATYFFTVTLDFNPVKRGLVAQVKDWPHSSFNKWVKRGDLPAAWGLVKQAGGNFGE